MSVESRVILQAGEIKVDADPAVLASMLHSLIQNKEYRAAFEKNPVLFLADCGVYVPEKMSSRITAENIDAATKQLTEGGPVAIVPIPGVAPGVAAGIRVGTSPAIRVGVQAAVNTTTFARDPRALEKLTIDDIMAGKVS